MREANSSREMKDHVKRRRPAFAELRRGKQSEKKERHGQSFAAPRSASVNYQRRYPIGAEVISETETHFRVWAPKARRVDVMLEGAGRSRGTEVPPTFSRLEKEDGGYFSGVARASAGDLYRFRLDEAEKSYPDPATRFQPYGPHAASMIVDAKKFQWTDEAWRGLRMPGQVVYEMHIGTFTREGSWRAASSEFAELRDAGITLIELMPVAEFDGTFGWGYDGVNLFAPCHLYGTPDDLRAFVNEAHAHRLGVILDVVYNHFGPSGNYIDVYSGHYLTKRHENDWGDSINFDDPNSGAVREFFITNGRYWIDEFHFDGFRFDATQNIIDLSKEYILGQIVQAAREVAGERSLIFLAENEPQETKLVRPRSEGGDGLDAVWNDDWHHTALVALTGRNEAYYTDYKGTPQEFISATKYGYLYQGQPYQWQQAPRGTPGLGIPPQAFVNFLENHDQIANSPRGERVRLLTSPGKYRALTALLLLGPSTPLLFQGQEFGASSPFVYFCDVSPDLRDAIRKGRFEFLQQFPSMATAEIQKQLVDPADPNSFARCKIDFSEREKNRHLYDLHKDLLKLRREDVRFREQKFRGVDGAVLASEAFVFRFFGDDGDDRLLVINLGKLAPLDPSPEPLLAPPLGFDWQTLWSSDADRYHGPGAVPLVSDLHWTLPAEAATVLHPVRAKGPRRQPTKRIR
jgi:maltooligosyltrehalose trehalohydrolase